MGAEERSRILVVEDNAASRGVVIRSLPDYELYEAEDGETALQVMESLQVDLVLLDLGLPGIDGYEVLRRIKTDPRLADTMVILVTARAHTREVVRGFESRADDYIVKPFQRDELAARVKSALRLKSLQDQLRHINQNLEQEVRQRTGQLMAQQQFALLGRNAAQLAHNLNSPLTALMGYIEIALGEPPEEHEELLLSAREVAVQMQEIIVRLLQGVRSRETLAESAEEVDLNAVITEQLTFWQVDAQFRYQVETVIELAEGLPPVRTNPADLRQIFTNLIDNALYALRDRPGAKLAIRTYATNGEVRLEVEDNGIGIRPENLTRIFEPSFTTKPVGEGTGLGLASSYELAVAYGGRLEVTSEHEVGTTFALSLPTAAAAADMPHVAGE